MLNIYFRNALLLIGLLVISLLCSVIQVKGNPKIVVANNFSKYEAVAAGYSLSEFNYKEAYLTADAYKKAEYNNSFGQLLSLEPLNISGLSDTLCLNEPPVVLTGTPPGGYFYGPGISGNNFRPAVAGVGTHTIGYVYTDTTSTLDTTFQDVTVLPIPHASMSGLDSMYCVDHPAVTLNGFPAGGFFQGAGISGNTFTPAVATIGIYEIDYVYIDNMGCSDTSTRIVEVLNLPTLVFTPSLPDVCENDYPFTLNNGFPAGGTYSGAGVTGNTFSPAQAGVGTHAVVYTYQDAYGCVNSISDSIEVFAVPLVELPLAFSNVCTNEQPITLTEGIPAGGVYSGSGVVDTLLFPTHLATGVSNVFYTYTDPATGCYSSDTAQIHIHLPPVAFAGNDTSICKGETIVLHAKGGDFYLWSTNETDSLITVTPLQSELYTLVAYAYVDTSNFVCSDTDAVFINVIPLPEVTLTSSQEMNTAVFGYEVSFIASPPFHKSYEFYINDNLMQKGADNTYTTTTLVGHNTIVVIAEGDSCISLPDTLNFMVKSVPNAFTPNNNGFNDRFLKGFDLQIYNRWGQLLYKGYDGWDGTHNGKNVAGGTYYYVARIYPDNLTEAQATIKGSVLLIRDY